MSEATESSDAGPPAAPTPLEPEGPLSGSLLWRLQRRYFEEAGLGAWRERVVPDYVTTNAFIAARSAAVAHAFLVDRQRLEPGRPVWIVELGAGSGRLALALLRELQRLVRTRRAPAAPFRYVLSDFAARTVAGWRSQPAFASLLAAGELALARFDLEDEAGLVLESGEALSPGPEGPALFALAHYVFDGLPFDVFYLAGGVLQAELVQLSVSGEPEDAADPGLLARAQVVRGTRRPLAAAPYPEPELNRLLQGYRRFAGEGQVPFPCAALRACLTLARLAPGRLFLLTADKGFAQAAELPRHPGLQLAHHGSVSAPVNYHALGELARALGGAALFSPQPHPDLCVAGLCFADPADHPATQDAFQQAVEEFGPRDYLVLQQGAARVTGSWTLGQLIAALRLSSWDPRFLRTCLPALTASASSATPWERRALLDGLARAWAQHLALAEDDPLPFALGVLCYQLGDPAAALEHYARAAPGSGAKLEFNRALCHCALDQLPQAQALLAELLAREPEHEAGRELLAEIHRWQEEGGALPSGRPGAGVEDRPVV